ncbi:hypothetical protein NM688_g6351 [Phlebia brevispora]|uniref:Uncharacterized protein n=1 Tax=Phlebia brevispora TaxID=194682 RepID=A0ACC1SGS9_9APHY|nr:hypothetical protein NM688_g6351 [Phlebia brevispora]
MAPRRGAPSVNTLSPPDAGLSNQGARSPGGTFAFPRSASPSNGFTSFLAKPTKWFNRSNSSGSLTNGRSSISSIEPRPSTSSGRKPKISHPTDPRPILDQLRPEAASSLSNLSGSGSRSVLDLSLARTNTALDDSPGASSMYTPSSPSSTTPSRGLGDLRNLSRKPWSKSADDLGKFSQSTPSLNRIDTSFRERVQSYRNNRNDSVGSKETPSSAHSPTSTGSVGGYPFPTITTNIESPSSSPPHRAPIHSPSSQSSPLSTSAPGVSPLAQPNPGLVHTRSHSFTPRLPSKLASPKLGLVPPSPKRKGFSQSELDALNRSVLPNGSIGSGPTPRPTFPFGFGSSPGNSRSVSPMSVEGVSPLDRPGATSTLLAPPTILEPGSDKSEKRTSQLVYHSGFINKLSEFSPAGLNQRTSHAYMGGGGITLTKGWKPFKLVLKGSKLYFYKPPSDRSAAVKELFPTELVSILEEEGIVEEPDSIRPVENDDSSEMGGGRGRETDDGKRKRAFWGSTTHPALISNGEVIERGTFEAFIHEAVFSTTFIQVHEEDQESEQQATDDDDADKNAGGKANADTAFRPEWRDFSCAVLFGLPLVGDRVIFEIEFCRCCTILASAADTDEKMQAAEQKISWLATQYLSYHGAPADVDIWQEWCGTTIPDVPLSGNRSSKLSGLPQSTSTQAIYSPSPHPDANGKSPNLGAFSPRPHDGDRMMSLLDVLGEVPPTSGKSYGSAPSLQEALRSAGFSRDLLLSLDAQLVARSLFVFNQQALRQVPNNVTTAACLLLDHNDTFDGPEGHSASSPLLPFIGSEEHPHWLTKLILLQILLSDTQQMQASQTTGFGRSIDGIPSNPTATRAHSRSDVITAWTHIGEICRRTGDDCSWRAIFAALCSRPVARLDKVWKRVHGDALRIVQSWVYPLATGESAPEKESTCVPWAGDSLTEAKELLRTARLSENSEWNVSYLLHAWRLFEGVRRDFDLYRGSSQSESTESSNDVAVLVKHWHDVFTRRGGNTGVASKFKRVDQFMSLSMAAEPRRKGLFEPYYWTRPPIQQTFHPLTPLLFPEPLPTVAFINRTLIHRGRLESTTSSINIQDLQHLREGKPTSEAQRKGNPDKADPLDLGGTIIIVYDGELMLLVQPGDPVPSQPPSRAPSRPPSSVVEAPPSDKPFSRNPSVRVKPGSKNLDRKPSQLRRSSLPALSKKPSFEVADIASERPLRVVIQAGTLDRLVDILVEGLHGVSVSVADDNGEMPLNDKKTRELRVDMAEFSRVWWSTFRSFVTPFVFFELLRKRYVAAQIKSQSLAPGELPAVIRTRSEVIETISRWIHDGGGAQDALDDFQLNAALLSFFRHPTEHSPPPVSVADTPSVQHGFALINDNLKAVFAAFTAQTSRPILRSIPVSDISTEASASISTSSSEPPDVDKLSPGDFIQNLDAMALATFRNVTQEDLFVTADILEVQTADRLGWFPAREPNAISDEVEIQSIHIYIHDIEPSSMISDLTQDSLYRLLPPAVRGCIRAFTILRKWLISKVAAYKIGLRTRQKRMETFLKAIEICRLRSMDASSREFTNVDRPCIRSFVEAVLTSAIISMESRMYHRAWQTVASARGTTCDTLLTLMGRPTVNDTDAYDHLTVDIGWLLERMVEIINLPDVIESSVQEGTSLVNFEKRRSLHTLITNPSSFSSRRRMRHRSGVDRKAFDRLNAIEQEVANLQFDLRVIREDAYREASQTPSLTKRQPRPFQTLVSAQQDKNKRDRTIRDRLSKEKRQEQQRQDKREEYLNKAMFPRRPVLPAQKQHRNKKSVSSAFMQLMRPISSAFISSETLPSGVKRTPAELDFSPSGKPAMVLNIAEAKVSQFVNNERSFTFQLDTEDGGHYLLQAMDRADLKKWMDTIDRVSKTAAKRRLTYLGHNPKMQMSDHLATSGTSPRDPLAVFGVDLEFLLQREAPGGDVAAGAIPNVFLRLVSEVESRGLSEIGIYRLAGAHSEVNSMKDSLNRGEWPIDSFTDINAVCDLIKSWFRVLPGGMFPPPLHVDLMNAAGQDEVDLDTRLNNIRRIIHELPRPRFNLLKRLVEHLDKVTDYEESNQMTAESLSTVFSPNLLRSTDDDVGFFFAHMSAAHRAVKLLITHGHTIFNDIEPDLDADQEEDEQEFEHFEEPILEEDEEEADLLSGENQPLDNQFPDEDLLPEPGVQEISAPAPPVLDFALPSPCDLSIPIPS